MSWRKIRLFQDGTVKMHYLTKGLGTRALLALLLFGHLACFFEWNEKVQS
jgi:hypothetical protein